MNVPPSAALVRELKELIIEALVLTDMTPDEIDENAPLLAEGLGLDSIDALELAIALDKAFGVKIRAEDENTRSIFRSVATLAAFVAENR